MLLRLTTNALILLGGCFLLSCQQANSNNSTETINQPDTNITEVVFDSVQFTYPWLDNFQSKDALINNIQPPEGYHRITNTQVTFASWLNHLPLSTNPKVYLFNGEEKYNQQAQYKVVNIDVGSKDLQQCADAVMRLRAEYLYATKQYDKIHFKYTNGVNIPYQKWREGYYPKLSGNKVNWVSSSNNKTYQSFRKYMDNIFTYAGTSSLSKELEDVIDVKEIQSGDVFIKGGFPGHAVIVVDVCVNNQTKDKCFMLAQSYMPAQNIHILQNPNNSKLSPWYSVSDLTGDLITPEWVFEINQLKRFKN